MVVPVDVVIDHTANVATVQMTTTLDQGASDESWGFREFVLLYEPVDDCVVFYSECNYGGQNYEVCRDHPNLANFQYPVKSIKIPDGVTVEGFDDENYKGKKVTFTESQ